jgi:hypothetical protein
VPAAAQSVTFVDLTDNVVVLNDGNFTCGFTSTSGVEFAHVVACVDIGGPGGQDGSAVAYMVEPAGSPYPGSISDVLSINVARLANSPQFQITIDFHSNNDNDPPIYPPANVPVLVENGLPQLLNAYFRDSSGDGIFLPAEVWAQSDVDKPTPASPASWGRVKATYR